VSKNFNLHIINKCFHIKLLIKLKLPGTDHEVLQFIVTLPSCSKSHCHRLLYNYSKADFQLFRETLSRVPWDSVIDYNSDIDSVWSQWCDLFLSVADSCIPKVK